MKEFYLLQTEMFMKSMEDDAKRRAEDLKVRNERAETLKRIANGAFKEGDYEKAVTYYSKALEQRKDSSVLWNNRALSHMHLGLYEKALHDCDWALKVNDSNLKALLNSAKCYMHLRDAGKSKEYIRLAKERNPHFKRFIDGNLSCEYVSREITFIRVSLILQQFILYFIEYEENMEKEFNKLDVHQVISDEQ